MTKASYQRTQGKRLTYDIQADAWGGYKVLLADRVLLSGHDPLAAGGLHRAPNKRKEAGAVACAQAAIEALRDMDEE